MVDDLEAIQNRLLALKRQAALDFARSSFANFVLWVDHGYQMKWYHRLLAEKLEEIAAGRLKRLIINMPPRHGKSQLVSRLFPAYLLGRNPDIRIISASYNAELASMMNRDVQRVIDSEPYRRVFPDTKLATHNARSVSGKALRNSDMFEVVDHRGSYRAAGVGGAVTGMGGDCLAGDTMIATELGPVAIADLVRLACRPRVLTFNHKKAAFEYRSIVAARELSADELVRIETAAGRHILATADHRIYVHERGYTPAAMVRAGDKVTAQHKLCNLRSGEIRQGPRLRALFRRGAARILRGFEMFFVRQGVFEAGVRSRQGIAQRIRRRLLLRDLLTRSSCNQESASLSGVPATGRKENSKILQSFLSRFIEGLAQALPSVSEAFADGAHILFLGLLRQGAQLADARSPESAFRQWAQLREMLPIDESAYCAAGCLPLRRVPGHVGAFDSSCRRAYTEQRSEQSNYVMQDVSHSTPQVADDTVSVVRPIRESGFAVYDIQVEGNHNFFANGILVHNCILVDDPVKNEEEARSPTYRQKVWEYWTNTLLTRQQSGAAIVICMTRWHSDDLVGRVVQRAAEDARADQWEVVCFPAIREDDANEEDPRQLGEALWPELYGLDYLERMRASMGEMGFAGLYQQRPTVAGGATLKEHRWCFWYRAAQEPPPVLARNADGALVACVQERLPEKFEREWQSWDMAFKGTDTSDWVVGQVQAKLAARAYLLDQVRGRMDFPRTVEAVRSLTAKWPRTRAKLVEDKANGPAVIAMLKREIPGLIAINPEGGKEARANAIAPLQEAQNLFLPHPTEASWVRQFLAECASFPKGKHDDQVDAYTQGINWAYGRRRVGKIRVSDGAW